MTTTPPAPTLTVYTGDDPCPRVDVLVSPMPGDAARITVYRSWLGRREVVRGARMTEVAGAFLVTDYLVPIGTQVTYTAVTYDSGGTPSEQSPTAQTTVSLVGLWVQDAIRPESALHLDWGPGTRPRPVGDSLATADFPMAVDIAVIHGSDLPIAAGSTRQSATNVPLNIVTPTPEDTDAFLGLLKTAFPLVVRAPRSDVPHLDGLVYLAVAGLSKGVSYGNPVRTPWAMTGTSVRAPGSSLVIAVRTLDDLAGEAATLDGLGSLYPTLIDLQRGP